MIDQISAVAPGGTATHPGGTQGSADLTQLAHRFNAMMLREPDPAFYTEQHLQTTGSPVAAFVQAQENLLSHTMDQAQALSADAAHLSMNEMAARQMELQQQIIMTSMQFNAAASVAQSGKSGLQTLMKNQ